MHEFWTRRSLSGPAVVACFMKLWQQRCSLASLSRAWCKDTMAYGSCAAWVKAFKVSLQVDNVALKDLLELLAEPCPRALNITYSAAFRRNEWPLYVKSVALEWPLGTAEGPPSIVDRCATLRQFNKPFIEFAKSLLGRTVPFFRGLKSRVTCGDGETTWTTTSPDGAESTSKTVTSGFLVDFYSQASIGDARFRVGALGLRAPDGTLLSDRLGPALDRLRLALPTWDCLSTTTTWSSSLNSRSPRHRPNCPCWRCGDPRSWQILEFTLSYSFSHRDPQEGPQTLEFSIKGNVLPFAFASNDVLEPEIRELLEKDFGLKKWEDCLFSDIEGSALEDESQHEDSEGEDMADEEGAPEHEEGQEFLDMEPDV